MADEQIGVVVAEGEFLLRAGLSGLVGEFPDLRIAGQAGNTVQLEAQLRRGGVDVVLMGSRLEDARASHAVTTMRQTGWRTPVLVLGASYQGRQHVTEAVRAGASAFLPMTVDSTELAHAIRRVHTGEAVFQLDPAWGMHLVSKQDTCRVTPRERQVLEQVERGLSNRQIGIELGIAMRTVDKHVENLMRKFDVRDRRLLARVLSTAAS
jgi:DNA-binding NarL/FixJ family response regulator